MQATGAHRGKGVMPEGGFEEGLQRSVIFDWKTKPEVILSPSLWPNLNNEVARTGI
jgi:hypothetical protein